MIALKDYSVVPNELIADVCRDSFYDFFLEFWSVLVARPLSNGWHIKYLCDELQAMAERIFLSQPKEYDLIINISPGSTKSSIVSVMFPAWLWTRMPDAAIIGASHTAELATDLSRKNRTVVKSDKYKECFPYIKVPLEQDAKGYFINTRGGLRFSAGIEGDVTGRHADVILVDDPVDPKGGRSEAKIVTANINIRETLYNRKKEPVVNPMIMIMQRVSEDDPTGMMLKSWPDPIKHICLPGELTDDVGPKELRKNYVDGLMFPSRHSWEFLNNAKKHGEYYYAGQYLQSPVPLGGAMFHVDRFAFENTPPKKWKMRMRYWDKAATKDSGTHTVGVLMGKDFDNAFWVLDVVRGQWDTAKRERMIKLTAETDGKGVFVGVEQEPGASGKESAQNTAKNLAGFKVRLDRPSGEKSERADPFSSQVNAGNVILKRGPWNRDYIEELRYFSSENVKGKDQVDASSGAFKFVDKPVIHAGGWRK
jgi:predicted phage terminase large subunit-like protein